MSTHMSAANRLPLALLLVLSSSARLRAQSSAPASPANSERRVVFDQGAFFGESEAMPHWEHGYLVSREVETFNEGQANIRLYDSSGALVRSAAVWFPGSQRVILYSVAVTSDGRIVAAGTANKSDGTSAAFIAHLDQSGTTTDVIQTNTFVPTNICLAPDDTVWSFGGNGYQSPSEPRPGDTLRHFDFRKGEIGSYLPRSLLTDLRSEPTVLAYIRCSSVLVSAYSPRAQTYIEMRYIEASPRLYHVPSPSTLKMHGFAVTEEKRIYGYFSQPNFGGLYSLALDPTSGSGTWAPVHGSVGPSTQSGVVTGLWGADSNNLLLSKSGDVLGISAIHWTAAPKP